MFHVEQLAEKPYMLWNEVEKGCFTWNNITNPVKIYLCETKFMFHVEHMKQNIRFENRKIFKGRLKQHRTMGKKRNNSIGVIGTKENKEKERIFGFAMWFPFIHRTEGNFVFDMHLGKCAETGREVKKIYRKPESKKRPNLPSTGQAAGKKL